MYDLRDNLVSFGKSPNSWWNDVQKSTPQTDLDKPKLCDRLSLLQKTQCAAKHARKATLGSCCVLGETLLVLHRHVHSPSLNSDTPQTIFWCVRAGFPVCTVRNPVCACWNCIWVQNTHRPLMTISTSRSLAFYGAASTDMLSNRECSLCPPFLADWFVFLDPLWGAQDESVEGDVLFWYVRGVLCTSNTSAHARIPVASPAIADAKSWNLSVYTAVDHCTSSQSWFWLSLIVMVTRSQAQHLKWRNVSGS